MLIYLDETSMHIGFIHPSYPSAEGTGATHSATQIVYGLAEAGHNIDVYCPDPLYIFEHQLSTFSGHTYSSKFSV
ncbi:glycosyl transferase family 1 [Halanaeroarchaeum sulfurireducens]|uniref:Glycosyl transferase family 1 n=1 Tax=Halanaeroarchaeum sulfurireducens TaxID=1604004 RepID=A0A0F7P9G5_9EURY|nr:glycosyl transferase family 1 [Halanaeroarchaeum sulfurireducens]ALG81823.1 glycosyl transferase family 1 [Halanaeroarchaeum sulfurireducens]